MLLTCTFAVENGSYVLRHLHWNKDYYNDASINYQKFSVLNDRYVNFNSPQGNFIVDKSSIFKEFDLGLLDYENPHILSVTALDYIILGEAVTVDILISKPLQNWGAKIDGVTPNKITYFDQHLYLLHRPDFADDKVLSVDVTLVDMGGNMAEQFISFNLYVDSFIRKIAEQKITDNDSLFSETIAGKTRARFLMLSIKSNEYPLVIDNIVLKTNIDPVLNPFTELSILAVSENSYVGYQTAITPNMGVQVPLLSSNVIDTSEKRYILCYSLNDTFPLGATFNIDLLSVAVHKVAGNQRQFVITTNLNSVEICAVPKTKPIIIQNIVPEYIGSRTIIDPTVVYELGQGTVNEMKYRIFDVTSGNIGNWYSVLNPTSSLAMATISPLQTYSQAAAVKQSKLSSSLVGVSSEAKQIEQQIRNLAFTHNHNYKIAFMLIGSDTSRVISSNSFLVDLTKPDRPSKNNLRGKVYSKNMALESATINIFKIDMDVPQWFDIESGLSGYNLLGKSATDPKFIDYASGNLSTTTGVQSVVLTLSNTIHTFIYAVQNKAGTWSDYSDELLVDLRSIGQGNVLYNSPNPFDSRIQNTTIYYTLQSNSDVEIKIYDMLGYLVKIYSYKSGLTGGQISNQLIWDGTNSLGAKVSKGGYILILKATDPNGSKTEKRCLIGVIH